jgi:hypothetical protein
MSFNNSTKLELLIDGFQNFWCCLEFYNDGEMSYNDFWESINIGWYDMELYPFETKDPWNLSGRDSYYRAVMRSR